MNCKKSLVILGKERKWVTLLGHNSSKMEGDWCPEPQTTRRVSSGASPWEPRKSEHYNLPCSKNWDRLFKFLKEMDSDSN